MTAAVSVFVRAASAALLSMSATALSVLMAVMAAHCVRIIGQSSGQEGGHLGIRISGGSGIERNTGLCQGIAGASADASADENLYAQILKESGQGSVSASVGVYHLGGEDFALLNLINLKLLCASGSLITDILNC